MKKAPPKRGPLFRSERPTSFGMATEEHAVTGTNYSKPSAGASPERASSTWDDRITFEKFSELIEQHKAGRSILTTSGSSWASGPTTAASRARSAARNPHSIRPALDGARAGSATHDLRAVRRPQRAHMRSADTCSPYRDQRVRRRFAIDDGKRSSRRAPGEPLAIKSRDEIDASINTPGTRLVSEANAAKGREAPVRRGSAADHTNHAARPR